jgi:phage virion morphogenesis protein
MRGDFEKLARMIGKFAGLATGQFSAGLRKQISEEGITQVKLGFRGERDPYGRKWKPIKYRQGKILRDTGRLANSFTRGVTSEGFFLGTNVDYAAIHQYGGVVETKSRINVHAKGGRFISRAKAGKRKRGAVKVSMSHAHSWKMPRRQMVPEADTGGLGRIWLAAFAKTGTTAMRRFMRAK